MIKTKNIRLICIYIYAFFIIYSPNILKTIGIESYYILALLAIIQLLFYFLKRGKIIKLITNDGFIFICSIFVLSIYYMAIALINGTALNELDRLRIIQNNMPIICLINVAFLVRYLKNLNYNIDDMLKFLFNVIFIQSLICILMVIIPQFRNIALFLYGNDNIFITSVRIYGISNDYTYATPIFHGMITSILTIYSFLNNKKKYYIYIPFFIITIFLNGRTGLIVYVITTLICLLIIGIKQKKMYKFFKILLIGTICFIIFINISKILIPSSYSFVKSLVNDTINFLFLGELTGNYASLFDSFLFFPKGINLLIGHSTQVIGTAGYKYNIYKSSDIGYVNDIFLGGISYAFSLYIIYYIFIKKKLTKNNKNYFTYNLFTKIIILSLIIANYKGEIFRSITMITGVILIKMIFSNETECKKNE